MAVANLCDSELPCRLRSPEIERPDGASGVAGPVRRYSDSEASCADELFPCSPSASTAASAWASEDELEDGATASRRLHEASLRRRRLGIVAALSPADLRAWQEQRLAVKLADVPCDAEPPATFCAPTSRAARRRRNSVLARFEAAQALA